MNENYKNESHSANSNSFAKKVLITSAIIAFVVVLLLILKETFNVFLLILAGTLIGLFFTGFGNSIQRKTNWKNSICVGISIVTTLLLVMCIFLVNWIKSRVSNSRIIRYYS